MGKQVPSVGRVVHFVYGDRHVPATIIDPTQNDAGRVTQCLQVFTLDVGAFVTFADFDPLCAPATWHWPEYVPAKNETPF